jgi:hypothetical protein
MTPFEFLLALYLIVAGLGLTLLVRSVGQIIEARERIQLYWIHTSWIALIFIVHITNWFAFWGFREVESWTVARFVLVISIPTILYLVSHISVPEVYGDDRFYDMREYYFARFRTIFRLLAAIMLLNILCEWVLLGGVQLSILNAVRLIAFAVLTLGLLSASPRLHAIVVLVLISLVVFGSSFINTALA